MDIKCEVEIKEEVLDPIDQDSCHYQNNSQSLPDKGETLPLRENLEFKEEDLPSVIKSEFRELKKESVLEKEEVLMNDVDKSENLKLVRKHSSNQCDKNQHCIFVETPTNLELQDLLELENEEERVDDMAEVKKELIQLDIRREENEDIYLVDDLDIQHELGEETLDSDRNPLVRSAPTKAPEPPSKRRRVTLSSEKPTTSSSATSMRRPAEEKGTIFELDADTHAGKDGHIWSTNSRGRRISQRHPPFTPHISGPSNRSKNAVSLLEHFDLFFDETFLSRIIENTNIFIDMVKSYYRKRTGNELPEVQRISHMTLSDIRALFGILILSGAKKDNHLNTSEMWSERFGCNLYRAPMSEQRFLFLIRCLRFDDIRTREDRIKNDNFTHIRDLWNDFISKCKENYTPGTNLKVDELLTFRGCCGFKQYISNNQSKYGIKLVTVCDVDSGYVLNAIPYLGSNTNPPKGMLLGEYFVLELMRPFYKSGRTVTTDNWFTTYRLGHMLLEENISLCGTIRRKPYIPEILYDLKNRKVKSSVFLFDKESTLVSYKATKSKVVILFSTEHHSANLAENGKPEIITFYNKTKGTVDTIDERCSLYSCSRKTNRWPQCLFYGIINAGIVNAHAIYTRNQKTLGQKLTPRRQFMMKLGEDLIRTKTRKRLAIPFLHRSVRNATICCFPEDGDERTLIQAQAKVPNQAQAEASDQVQAEAANELQANALNEVQAEAQERGRGRSQKRCKLCPRKFDRKSQMKCFHCNRNVCKDHSSIVCSDCRDC